MITVEELATKWSDTLERLIRKHGFLPSDVDDVKQELFVAWIVGRYSEVYDPTKSAPSTFIHHFVSTRLKGYRSKKKRDPLHRAIPLVQDGESGRGILVDLIEGTPEVAELRHRVDEASLLLDLQGMNQPGYAGHVKDYVQVYRWMAEGKSVTEMAALTEYSLGSVSVMAKKVREVVRQHTYMEV